MPQNSDSNSNSNSNTKTTLKLENPPLLKKSRTINDDVHFPGPLFPAVRRVSTLPPQRPSDLRVSVDNDGPANQGNFSDRDWFYPSFVVPHAPKRGLKPGFSDSSNRINSIGTGSNGKAVNTTQTIAPSTSGGLPELKKVEVGTKESKFVSGRDSVSSITELTQSSCRRSSIHKEYLVILLVSYHLYLYV